MRELNTNTIKEVSGGRFYWGYSFPVAGQNKPDKKPEPKPKPKPKKRKYFWEKGKYGRWF